MALSYNPEAHDAQHTNIYYKDSDNILHCVKADTGCAKEAREAVIDMLSVQGKDGAMGRAPTVLALVQGGKLWWM